jgi:hypothetical protein
MDGAYSMLRKIIATAAVVATALVTFGGVAAADVDYGADRVVALGVADEDREVDPGETFNLILGGFQDSETVDITGAFSTGQAPSGLRSGRSVALRDSPLGFTVTVAPDGTAALPVSYDQDGYVTFVANGRISGSSDPVTIKIGTGGEGAPTTAPTSEDSPLAALKASKDDTNTANDALAYTGASVAGPLAIGLAALLLGLGLLFFGTRGVIRRKSAASAGSSAGE